MDRSLWRRATDGVEGVVGASLDVSKEAGRPSLRLHHYTGGDPSDWPEDHRVRRNLVIFHHDDGRGAQESRDAPCDLATDDP